MNIDRYLYFICAAAILVLSGVTASAQKYGYEYPMELQPASFSGTYGELRGNHFHAGVDWRTNGRVGQPLHAIKDGYICRLSVSPTGYGNAVYINHGDGTMSVYGHMNDFRDDIAARIRREQYAKESYSVDFTLTEDEFPIEQGEVFGHSGNTGSSGGPHLHMEIRKDDGNLPLNYLADGTYPVEDKTSPTIRRVGFYAYEDTTSVPLTSRLAMISSPQSYSGVVPVSEKFYVAVDAVDLMDKASFRYAVDRYTVYFDSKKVFSLRIGDVPYSDGKYYKCLVQEGEKGADLIKSHVVPNNGFAYKSECTDNGIMTVSDTRQHTVRIVVADPFGNTSSCELQVRRSPSAVAESAADTTGRAMLWYMPNFYMNEDLTFVLPAASLMNSAYVACTKVGEADRAGGIYSGIWQIGDADIPLVQKGRLRFAEPDSLDCPAEKLFVAGCGSGGSLWYAGKRNDAGALEARCGFGTYCVAVDTLAPVLSPRVTDGAALPDNGRFSVEASDDRSGIASYRVEMDGKWILCQLHRGRIQVYPDASHKTGKMHSVRVSAADNCENCSEIEFSVKY